MDPTRSLLLISVAIIIASGTMVYWKTFIVHDFDIVDDVSGSVESEL